MCYAHTPVNGQWHDLLDHLKSVAELAAEFGKPFGAEDVCRVLGLAHDLGKADERFQEYLRAASRGVQAKSHPHSPSSAAYAYEQLGLLTLAILGHHAGLPDVAAAKDLLDKRDTTSDAAISAFLDLGRITVFRPLLPGYLRDNRPVDWEMFIRMTFSALVDADRLDTEAHVNPLKSCDRGEYPELPWYTETLENHLTRMQTTARRTKLNKIRSAILDACRAAAKLAPGAFRLTVPCGGGKTLSSLAFALRHGLVHDLRRVVVAIPYTSIIDQTAKIYGGIFGPERILEHHSALDFHDTEAENELEELYQLAAENWDCPLIVTTSVTLFESLFANKPGRCRKIHRLARSVIVLDEVQTLPTGLLRPIMQALDLLIRRYGCTVLFCTATQPDFSDIAEPLLCDAKEIAPNPPSLFADLRRVEYVLERDPMDAATLGASLDQEHQVLCIVNSRPDAARITKACNRREGLFHLSTLLCPHHRKEVLRNVRDRLQKGDRVCLVATQVVEAGVDVDFPKVFRAVAPLDRIVQAAGRCNREGKLERPGTCIVFELADGHSPQGWYATGTALARTAVRENIAGIDTPVVQAKYFRDLFSATDTDSLGILKLQAALSYGCVAAKFRMIADDTSSAVVENYAPDVIERLVSMPVESRGRKWYREISQYAVSLPSWQVRKMEAEGMISQLDRGPAIYIGKYDPVVGVGTGEEHDPIDLIV